MGPLAELWAESVRGWRTAAAEARVTCEKDDSIRNHGESFSLALSAFALLSSPNYLPGLEQQDGPVVRAVGSAGRDLSSGVGLHFSYC